MADDYKLFYEYLTYDPKLGRLYWKKSPSHNVKLGSEANSVDAKGYGRVMLKKKAYKTHRVCWLLYYGHWPKSMLDHCNGNPIDNRIENLREVNWNQNACNRAKIEGKTSKYKGVCIQGKYWASLICKNGKQKRIGYFTSEKEAALAYNMQAEKLFGPYARFNKVF